MCNKELNNSTVEIRILINYMNRPMDHSCAHVDSEAEKTSVTDKFAATVAVSNWISSCPESLISMYASFGPALFWRKFRQHTKQGLGGGCA